MYIRALTNYIHQGESGSILDDLPSSYSSDSGIGAFNSNCEGIIIRIQNTKVVLSYMYPNTTLVLKCMMHHKLYVDSEPSTKKARRKAKQKKHNMLVVDSTARLFYGNYEDRRFGVNDILTTLGVQVHCSLILVLHVKGNDSL